MRAAAGEELDGAGLGKAYMSDYGLSNPASENALEPVFSTMANPLYSSAGGCARAAGGCRGRGTGIHRFVAKLLRAGARCTGTTRGG